MKKLSIEQMLEAASLNDPVEQIRFAVENSASADEALLMLSDSYDFDAEVIGALENNIRRQVLETPSYDFVKQIRQIEASGDYLRASMFALRYFPLQDVAKGIVKLFPFAVADKVNTLVKSLIELKNKVPQAETQIRKKRGPKPQSEQNKQGLNLKTRWKASSVVMSLPQELIEQNYSLLYSPVYLNKPEIYAIKVEDGQHGNFIKYEGKELDTFQQKEQTQETAVEKWTPAQRGTFTWIIRKLKQKGGYNVVVVEEGNKRRAVFLPLNFELEKTEEQ